MIGNIVDSIKSTLYDRVNSPFFGSYSISWIFWNFDIALIIFSSMSAESKIEYINELSIRERVVVFGAPFIVSMAYIYVYPLFEKSFYKRWRGNQSNLKEIKTSFDEEDPLSREQARNLINKHISMQREFSENYASVLSEIENYKKEISSYLNEKEHLSKELESIRESQNITNEEKEKIRSTLEKISIENKKLREMVARPIFNKDDTDPTAFSINHNGEIVTLKVSENNLKSSYLDNGEYSFSSGGLKKAYSMFDSLLEDLASKIIGVPKESAIHIDFDLMGQPKKYKDVILFLSRKGLIKTGDGKFNLTLEGVDLLSKKGRNSDLINSYFGYFMDKIKKGGFN